LLDNVYCRFPLPNVIEIGSVVSDMKAAVKRKDRLDINISRMIKLRRWAGHIAFMGR
jgi:hypothetical protein